MLTRRAQDKPALTGIRGIGAIAIFIAHSHLPAAIEQAHPLAAKIKEVGWISVPVFFVLSGYLITWLALNERESFGSLDLSRFYKRRFLRIFPLYFGVSAALLLAWYLPHTQSVAASPESALAVVTFTVNFFVWTGSAATLLGALLPLWTVAAEEQFYFVWGLGLRFVTPRNLGIAATIGLLVSVIVRLSPGDYSTLVMYRINPGVSLGSIMVGCLMGIYQAQIRSFVGARDLTWLAVAAIVLIAYFGWPAPTSALGAAALVSAVDITCAILVLEGARASSLSRALSGRSLVHIGELSYAVYLSHIAIISLYFRVKSHTPQLLALEIDSPYLSFAVDVTVTALITLLTAKILTRFESPFLRMRQRLRRDAQLPLSQAGTVSPGILLSS